MSRHRRSGARGDDREQPQGVHLRPSPAAVIIQGRTLGWLGHHHPNANLATRSSLPASIRTSMSPRPGSSRWKSVSIGLVRGGDRRAPDPALLLKIGEVLQWHIEIGFADIEELIEERGRMHQSFHPSSISSIFVGKTRASQRRSRPLGTAIERRMGPHRSKRCRKEVCPVSRCCPS